MDGVTVVYGNSVFGHEVPSRHRIMATGEHDRVLLERATVTSRVCGGGV
jgi:hypothetical protein